MMSQHREEAVWKRVMETAAQAPAQATAPPNALTAQAVWDLWQQERQQIHSFHGLSQGKRPFVSQSLRQMATQAKQWALALEAVYYVMTGRRPQPGPLPPGAKTLRECCLQARQIGETCGRLAKQRGPYAKTMEQLQEGHLSQAEALLALIARSL